MKAAASLEEITQNAAAALGTVSGVQVVLHYGDPAAEYAALTAVAGLVDLGERTQIEMTGRDRAGFLNRLATNKIDDLPAGAGCETFLTDAKAHVLAWLLVFSRAESLLLDADPGCAAKVLAHLNYYLIREDVALLDHSPQRAELLLAGPRSGQLLGKLTPSTLPVGHLAHVDTSLAGQPVSLRRLDLGGPDAFLVACDRQAAAAVWGVLRQTGAAACGRQAAEAVRIESGWPQYGRDVTEQNLPQEVARDRLAISFRKGCYLGQETIARIDSRGHVNKKLVGLWLATGTVPPDGTVLRVDGQPVGAITSAAYSPGARGVVALGYVRRGHDHPGAVLACPAGPARVVGLPAKPPARQQ